MSPVLINVIAGIASGLTGWWIGRRTQNAKAAGHELENVEQALGIYRDIIADLHTRIKDMKAKLSEMEKKQDELEIKLYEAEAIISEYRRKYNN